MRSMKHSPCSLVPALALLLSCAAPAALHAQSAAQKAAWLKQNSHELRSVATAQNDDFSDLAPFGEALKSVRVVALGESTHGDGSTMLMKTRLIRYLHEHLGFDVIAWESGMADVRTVQTALCDPDILPEVAAAKGLYQIWTSSQQLVPLWEYVRATQRTSRPLTLAGFDCKFTSNGSSGMSENAMRHLRQFFERASQTRDEQLKWAQLELATRKLQLPMHMPGSHFDAALYDAKFVQDLAERIDTRREAFRRVWSDREIDFTRQLIRSIGYIERYVRETFNEKGQSIEPGPDSMSRDMSMGLNLLWLAEQEYPDSKIIVWAHNGHVTESYKPTSDLQNFRTVGLRGSAFALIKYVLKEQAYSLGFLSSEGSFNYPNAPDFVTMETLPPPPAGSLQELCMQSGRPLFFLDFGGLPKKHWLRQPIAAGFMFHGKGYSNPKEMVQDWTQSYDGMLYIRRMEPSLTVQRLGTAEAAP